MCAANTCNKFRCHQCVSTAVPCSTVHCLMSSLFSQPSYRVAAAVTNFSDERSSRQSMSIDISGEMSKRKTEPEPLTCKAMVRPHLPDVLQYVLTWPFV